MATSMAFEFLLIRPELFVLTMCNVILMAELFFSHRMQHLVYYLSQTTLFGAFVLTALSFGHGSHVIFHHMVRIDDPSHFLKMIMYLLGFFVFLYSRDYIRYRKIFNGEFYLLSLFSLLGMMVLVSAASLLTLYMGLELVTLPIYAMVAMRRDVAVCAEASMKYFVMGALATGILLYGMSMLYGIAGSLDITEISRQLGMLNEQHHMVAVFSMVFVVIGVAFKFGAVPFHMWLPDIYEGAPTAVTLFLGTLPKVAALGMAIRLFADTMGPLSPEWQHVLMIFAVLSLSMGNVIAVVQTNIKRLLAYSTIAHVGFILLGLSTGPEMGYAPATYYVVVYALTVLGALGLIVALSGRDNDIEAISDLKGLSRRNPWLALMMLLVLFSMAGVPPLAGFYAKFMVINALVQTHHINLAIIAVLFSVIGAFYYIRVVKVMYFDEPAEANFLPVALDTRVALSINGLAMILLGVMPSIIWHFAT